MFVTLVSIQIALVMLKRITLYYTYIMVLNLNVPVGG